VERRERVVAVEGTTTFGRRSQSVCKSVRAANTMANEKSLKESLLAASPFLVKVVEIVSNVMLLLIGIRDRSKTLDPTNRIVFAFSGLLVHE